MGGGGGIVLCCAMYDTEKAAALLVLWDIHSHIYFTCPRLRGQPCEDQ